MIEIKSPGRIPSRPSITIFLAGSIEMGSAVDWQQKVVDALSDIDCTILNPRREDWDPTWVQEIANPAFNEQVNWELNGIEWSDIVVFYFDPNTKSPITLMELGYLSGYEPWRSIVCCPEKFWRKGNVDILCQRESITQVDSLDSLILNLRTEISKLS